MAPYTYYYFFSIIIELGIGLCLVNLILLKTKRTTTFGLKFKPGTPKPGTLRYKTVRDLTSTRSLVGTTFLLLVFGGGLLDSIRRIVQLNTPAAHELLIFAPALTIFLFGIMMIIMRYQFKKYIPGKHEK